MKKHLTALLLLVGTALASHIPVNKKAVESHILNIAQAPSAGMASWYGRREQGRRMANGRRYDRHGFTCASLKYKLGTLLMVRFPQKGTFVIVRVTDHGPWVKGRILDLSEQAAATLGLKPYGVARVEVEPVRIMKGMQ